MKAKKKGDGEDVLAHWHPGNGAPKKRAAKKKSSLRQPSKVDFVGDLEQIQKFFELKRSPRLPPANTLVPVLALNAQRDRVFKI